MSETHSILIAEVTGEMPLMNKIGARETERAVDRCRNRAERAIESNEGESVQTEGRWLVARFKRCENAVLAAFDMRSRVAQLPPVSGVSLLVRIALHAGSQEAETIANAKSIAAIAPDTQIVLSANALAALPESLRHCIDLDLKLSAAGYDLPIHAFKTDASSASIKESLLHTATSLTLPSIPSNFATEEAPPPPSTSSKASLRLRHENSNFVVSDLRPVLLAGREDGNDLVITDKRASRHHARLEWRQNRFVLIDTSTNGTYLADEQGNEVVLRRSEADLPPRGRIGFGYSPLEASAEVVFFDISQR